MWPFKKPKRKIWEENMILLYERQIAAREALGEKYAHHPANHVRRKNPAGLRLIK